MMIYSRKFYTVGMGSSFQFRVVLGGPWNRVRGRHTMNVRIVLLKQFVPVTNNDAYRNDSGLYLNIALCVTGSIRNSFVCRLQETDNVR